MVENIKVEKIPKKKEAEIIKEDRIPKKTEVEKVPKKIKVN